MNIKKELIKICLDKYENGDWYYTTNVNSNSLSKDEVLLTDKLVSIIGTHVKELNYKKQRL